MKIENNRRQGPVHCWGAPADRDLQTSSRRLLAHAEGDAKGQKQGVPFGTSRLTNSPLRAPTPAASRALDVRLAKEVLSGRADAAKDLVSRGANPDCSCQGVPALVRATQQGDIETMRILIAAGADVRSRTPAGQSALYVAVAEQNLLATSLLLESGADAHAAWSSLDARDAAELRAHWSETGLSIFERVTEAWEQERRRAKKRPAST